MISSKCHILPRTVVCFKRPYPWLRAHLDMTPQSRAQRNLPRPGMPLEITSTENKRWLLKSQCDRHIHLGLAVWKGGDWSPSYVHLCYFMCAYLNSGFCIHSHPNTNQTVSVCFWQVVQTNQCIALTYTIGPCQTASGKAFWESPI